jgi:hypothetical protein
MSKYHLFRHVVAFIFVATSSNVFAVNCNDKSPYFEKEGDSYNEIEDVKPPTKKQKSKLNELFSRFENKSLTGSRSLINCVGPEGSAKKTTTKTELTAKLEQLSDGKIVINVETYDRKRKTTRDINLSYFGSNGREKIIKLTSNKLKIRGKYRQRAEINEEITNISVKSRKMTIVTTAYRYGRFAYKSTIKLQY